MTRGFLLSVLLPVLLAPTGGSAHDPVTQAAVASTPSYTVTDLGTLGGAVTKAMGVNEDGDVVGASQSGTYLVAFLWDGGTMTGLGELGAQGSWAYDVNDAGQAVEGLHSSGLIQAIERMRVVFMTETDPAGAPTVGYRSNLGLLNGTGVPLTVMVARHDQGGAMLGDVTSVELEAWENTQLNRLLRGFAPPVDGYVDIWTEPPVAPSPLTARCWTT